MDGRLTVGDSYQGGKIVYVDDNFVSIAYSSISYSSPDGSWYMYPEPEWITAVNNHVKEEMSKRAQPAPPMSSPNQAGGPVNEDHYELPGLTETFEAVTKAMRTSSGSIQQTLENLASQGYYLVKRRSHENQTPEII